MGSGDEGQPTHFYSGSRWWVFNIVVQADWPKDKRLVWTLTNMGGTPNMTLNCYRPVELSEADDDELRLESKPG